MLCVHSSTHRLLVASFLSHTHQSPINRLRIPLRLSSDWKVVDNPIFAQAMSAVASLILAQGCFSIASEMKDLPFSLDLPRNHYHWFDYSLLLQFIYYYCKYYPTRCRHFQIHLPCRSVSPLRYLYQPLVSDFHFEPAFQAISSGKLSDSPATGKPYGPSKNERCFIFDEQFDFDVCGNLTVHTPHCMDFHADSYHDPCASLRQWEL
jgi:hypothetical protein